MVLMGMDKKVVEWREASTGEGMCYETSNGAARSELLVLVVECGRERAHAVP